MSVSKKNNRSQDDNVPKSLHVKTSTIVVISQIVECKQNKTRATITHKHSLMLKDLVHSKKNLPKW